MPAIDLNWSELWRILSLFSRQKHILVLAISSYASQRLLKEQQCNIAQLQFIPHGVAAAVLDWIRKNLTRRRCRPVVCCRNVEMTIGNLVMGIAFRHIKSLSNKRNPHESVLQHVNHQRCLVAAWTDKSEIIHRFQLWSLFGFIGSRTRLTIIPLLESGYSLWRKFNFREQRWDRASD
jgi:hypothetical protein